MATFSYEGIDVTVSGTLNVDFGSWHDGMMWILPTTTISGWTPATGVRSSGRYVNGGRRNPTGTDRFVSTDSGSWLTFVADIASQNVPALAVGDVLVIARSCAENVLNTENSDRTPGQWVYGNSKWQMPESVLTIHCVGAAPPANAIRPPVACLSSLRAPYCASPALFHAQFELAVANLPEDLDSAHAQFPDYAEVIEAFKGFSGECYEGWAAEFENPRWHHPGYAPSQCAIVSMALCMLCSDMPYASKLPLAKLMVQRGLDYAAAWLSGNAIDDGHGYGRKALIVLAGHLLGLDNLKNIDNALGLSPVRFPESNQGNFFNSLPTNPTFHWWHRSDWNIGWRTGQYKPWTYWPEDDGSGDPSLNPLPFSRHLAGTQVTFEYHIAGHQLAFPPESWPRTRWNVPGAGDHDALQRWAMNGYYTDHHQALVGTCLAMRILDLEAPFGTFCMRSMEQFFEGMDAYNTQLLLTEGVVLDWGTSHQYDAGWCAAMWILHS